MNIPLLPLYAIALPAPLPVRALKKSGDVNRGDQVLVTLVRQDGMVAILNSEDWHKMASFVLDQLPMEAVINAEGK